MLRAISGERFFAPTEKKGRPVIRTAFFDKTIHLKSCFF